MINENNIDALLSVAALDVGYSQGEYVLEKVSLKLFAGEMALVVGANGSGKSTLLRAILGDPETITNETARLSFLQADITQIPIHQRYLSGMLYIAQSQEFFEDLSVMRNLLLLTNRITKLERERRLAQYICLVPAMNKLLRKAAITLSGGERKLVSLCIAYIIRPPLLLLDEPLAGVSELNTPLIIKILTEIRGNNTAMLLVEHRIDELLTHCDSVLAIRSGRLSEVAPSEYQFH